MCIRSDGDRRRGKVAGGTQERVRMQRGSLRVRMRVRVQVQVQVQVQVHVQV